jgi:Mg2+ and Co2+ transporter CorA
MHNCLLPLVTLKSTRECCSNMDERESDKTMPETPSKHPTEAVFIKVESEGPNLKPLEKSPSVKVHQLDEVVANPVRTSYSLASAATFKKNKDTGVQLLAHHFEAGNAIDLKALSEAFTSTLQKKGNASTEKRMSFYSKAGGVKDADSLSELLDGSSTSGFFWLSVSRATPIEIETIAKVLDIHPLTAEDLRQDECREKCEVGFN